MRIRAHAAHRAKELASLMSQPVLRTALLVLICLSLLAPTLGASKERPPYRDQVAVLMYHHVHDTDLSSSTVTPELFRSQLVYLRERGYRFISLSDFERFMEGGEVPPGSVLVTFDDGYRSYREFAYPILKELGIPSVNFIITETLDHPLESNIPYLSREDLAALTGDPEFVRAECHTHAAHRKSGEGRPLLTDPEASDGQRETEEDYRRRVVQDMNRCVDNLRPYQPEPAKFLAYPFGAYNSEASRLVQEGGMRYAFTIVPEMATRRSDALRIPRINAGSPFITPVQLERTIRRRVVAVEPAT